MEFVECQMIGLSPFRLIIISMYPYMVMTLVLLINFVHQGSVLRPHLFLLYMNKLKQ